MPCRRKKEGVSPGGKAYRKGAKEGTLCSQRRKELRPETSKKGISKKIQTREKRGNYLSEK